MENKIMLQAIESLMDNKLNSINESFTKIEKQIDKLSERIDSVESMVDKLGFKMDKLQVQLEAIEKVQDEIKETQKTILDFVSEADFEFTRLDEKTKDMEKIKKIININNIV